MKLLTAIVAATLMLASVRAQTPSGVLAGMVRDWSGDALPGVRVFARAGDTRQETVSDSGGRYRFELPAGSYRVEAQLQGFRATVIEPVIVAAAKQVQCDLTLRPAGLVTAYPNYGSPVGGLAEVVNQADVVAHLRVVSSSAADLLQAQGNAVAMEHAAILLTVVKGSDLGIRPGPAKFLQMNAGVWLEDGLRLVGQHAPYRPGDEFVTLLRRDSSGRLHEFMGPHLTFRVTAGTVSQQGMSLNGFTNGMTLENFLDVLRKLV